MARPAEPLSHVIDGIHLLPVLHERLEFADHARRVVAELSPDAVAVEIPSSLERIWLRAVDRLPQISVLLYETSSGKTIYLPVQPADAMVEAARWAREHDVPLCCADLDIDGYADYRDPVPDAYAVLRLGLRPVYEAFRQLRQPADPADSTREAAMAHHARRLRAAGAQRVLLLCGMHHAAAVAQAIGHEQAVPLTPPARKNARLVHLHPESMGEVLSETPFYVATYEARRTTMPVLPASAEGLALPARSIGPFRILSGGRGAGERTTHAEVAVARAACEAVVGDDLPAPGPIDRLRAQWVLTREAETALATIAPDEEVRSWQRVQMARFSRNLALLSGQLVPDLFDLIAAARGCISENYAYELHRLAIAYPAQTVSAPAMPTARIRADQMWDGIRRVRLERRLRRPKRPDWSSIFRRRRRQERFSGEWLQGFDNDAICSYPPEDLVIEEFGRYLKKRGKQILSEERSRTLPFSTSVLDGIDVRETIRHWSEGRVYVRELGRAPGGVGSLVVIFDDDEERYAYSQTWLGEHEQESDMAFFSTEPTQGIVGPGICRVTYGGLMMSYPPGRMGDIWTDPDYRTARTKAELLLLAAMDYTLEPIVVHAAPRPPRSLLFQLAARLGLKILHLPLGTLSPTTVRRLRVMHVLSGHAKREIAAEYIW